MRIPKSWIPILSKDIVEELLHKEFIKLKESQEKVTTLLSDLMLEELMVEDRLNDEVREILKEFDAEIEKGRLDYRRLFDMTKQKLVRERNIII